MVLGLAGLRFYFEHNKARIVADLNKYITEHINGTMRIGSIDLSAPDGFSDSLADPDRRRAEGQSPGVASAAAGEANRRRPERHEAVPSRDRRAVDPGRRRDHRPVYRRERSTNFDIFKTRAARPGAGTGPQHPRDPDPRRRAASRRLQGRETCAKKKLFHFVIDSLSAPIDYEPDGPRTRLKLKALARSMIFLSTNGSFIRDQQVAGVLKAAFSKSTGSLTVETNALAIGKDSFAVKGRFAIGQKPALFDLEIRTKIRWLDASRLLSDKRSADTRSARSLEAPRGAMCHPRRPLRQARPRDRGQRRRQGQRAPHSGRRDANVSFHGGIHEPLRTEQAERRSQFGGHPGRDSQEPTEPFPSRYPA